MLIPIEMKEETLYITSDERQFMLSKKAIYKVRDKVTKEFTGEEEEQYNAIGYYTSLESLIKDLVKKKLLQSDATSLQELLGSVQSIQKEVEQWVKV